jgi:hypothetical protein
MLIKPSKRQREGILSNGDKVLEFSDLEVFMQKWEYRRLCYGWDDESKDLVWADSKETTVDGDTVDQRLNELGEQGWELISVEKISDLSHVVVTFYLKRPIE